MQSGTDDLPKSSAAEVEVQCFGIVQAHLQHLVAAPSGVDKPDGASLEHVDHLRAQTDFGSRHELHKFLRNLQQLLSRSASARKIRNVASFLGASAAPVSSCRPLGV